jgi:hypothetical protein
MSKLDNDGMTVEDGVVRPAGRKHPNADGQVPLATEGATDPIHADQGLRSAAPPEEPGEPDESARSPAS